ncbi:MAG: TatD family hydrolase [Bacteroidaceae bacterium]
MKFIDTHSHLFLEEFQKDLPLVIERAKLAGVSMIFMPNIDSSTLEPLMKTASVYKGFCYPMIGLHPTSVDINYKNELQTMKFLLDKPNDYVAIGEVGMDLYWDKSFVEEQLDAFEKQIQWAIEYRLPIIIHSRNAFDETYQLIRKYNENDLLTGIFHSFTGTEEEANKLLEFKGFKLGINGVVTFNKSTLPYVLKQIPLERIVLETDSPYLTPVPNRGKRNESANTKDILCKIAAIYKKTDDEIATITTNNALTVFKMPR